jgi:hypothetical protein
MPKGVYDRSKVKTTPPTIRQRANEEDDKTLTGAPEPSVQTSTGLTVTVDGTKVAKMVREKIDEAKKEAGLIPPLVTFHLRRVENELTDTARTVHIPSPASIKDGERVVIHVYREE